jgi:N-acetylglucosaminyldiphosphoundecaprenol N-acetyl-beta-D-mannosaminyltransferase
LSGQSTNSSKPESGVTDPKHEGKHSAYVDLLGVHLHDLSKSEIVSSIIDTINAGERAIFVYVNIYAINLAHTLPWFRNFLNKAEAAYCDGFGVLIGARLAGYQLLHRSTPPDWIFDLAVECASRGITIFLLGGRSGVAERAASFLIQQLPELHINGSHHGYFDPTPAGVDNNNLVQRINQTGSDILLVGMGMPLQEAWLDENWEHLNIKVALPVGALLDYMGEEKHRPPYWMTKYGLEWAGRLFFEPRRLWKRYLLGIPKFFFMVFRQRLDLGL